VRIVSLVPSATEIVCALGLTDALVGISHDCDYPPEIRGRQVLSGAVVSPEMPSGAIDARIRAQVHNGMSVYHLDADRLGALQPDLILTQELCEVCAPSFTEVRQAARILSDRTRLVSLEPHGLDDILETIALVGDLTSVPRAARQLVLELRDRIESIRRLAVPDPRPRVACLEWLDPVFVAGHWVPEMVALAGGTDGLGRACEKSVVVSWDAVRAYDPEIVVVAVCGFDIARTRHEMSLLTDRPGWRDLTAVQNGRVYLADGGAYFSRPGPRVVHGLECLSAIIRAPERVDDIVGVERLAI
jgi:iron complex transport system substrate-binding protein